MQKISLNYFDVAKKEKQSASFIVASTKTKNILFKDLENENKIPFVNTAQVQEIFIERSDARAMAIELSSTLTTLSDDEKKLVVEKIVEALEVACIVKRA